MMRKCLLVGKRKKMRIEETHRVRRIMMVSPLFCITLNHIIAFMCIDPRLHSFSRSRTLINRDVVQVGYQFCQISSKKSVIRVYCLAISIGSSKDALSFFLFHVRRHSAVLVQLSRSIKYNSISIRECFRSTRFTLSSASFFPFPLAKIVSTYLRIS